MSFSTTRSWRPSFLHAGRPPGITHLAPSLLGTLQRHGLVVQNDKTGEAIEEYSQALEKQIAEYERQRTAGTHRFRRTPGVSSPAKLAPEPTWSPTELGEQVFLQFLDAGTKLEDVWSSGSADQQTNT